MSYSNSFGSLPAIGEKFGLSTEKLETPGLCTFKFNTVVSPDLIHGFLQYCGCLKAKRHPEAILVNCTPYQSTSSLTDLSVLRKHQSAISQNK